MADKKLKEVIQKVAGTDDANEKKVEEQVQLVVYALDKEDYGTTITDLQEVIEIQEVTPIPNAPEFIEGVLNLRGRIVVVINLEKRFGLKRETKNVPSHIIITEVDGNLFGVMVDYVKEVMQVPVSAIRKTPELVTTKIKADYLSGVVVLGEEEDEEETKDSRLIILLDLKKFLNDEDLMNLGDEIQGLDDTTSIEEPEANPEVVEEIKKVTKKVVKKVKKES